MKKNIFVFGTIAGLILTGFMMYAGIKLYNNPGDFSGNTIVGFAGMIGTYALMFAGIKNYRDKYNGGVISFGKAFKNGFLIALLASTFVVVTWLVAYYAFIPDFLDKYYLHMQIMAKTAESVEMMKQADQQMKVYSMFYKTPFGVAFVTYLEVLPIGVVVALISAFILKRKISKNQNV